MRSRSFQSRLRWQIMRLTLVLSACFFVGFMSILFLYSIHFNSYQAEKCNQALSDRFIRAYEEHRAYLSPSGAGREDFLRCLDGEISGATLSFIYRSFSRDCSVSSNLILTDARGELASTTYPNPSYSQLHFNGLVVNNALDADAEIYNTVYYLDGNPRYVFAGKIRDDGGTYRGMACLYLDMYEMTDAMHTLQYSGIIVHNGSNVVVADDQRIVKDFNYFPGMRNGQFELDGQSYWMYSTRLDRYNVTIYTYVTVVSFWGYYMFCALFSIAFCLIAMLLSAFIARNIAQHSSASVEQLQAQIDRIAESGSGLLDIKTGDEFENIADHINTMLANLRELSDHNYELLRLNNRMEMRALESKFNPHFLYNTLDSIRFAVRCGMPGGDAALLNLTRLLRYSVGDVRSEVSLEEDLPHIQNYLDIMKFRFGDSFTYDMDIEPNCMQRSIPRLLLQPVIENSVKYGFEGRQSVSISIRGRLEEDGFLRLTVVDNGMGIQPDRLEWLKGVLKNPVEVREGAGYSELQSTARRLHLQYGRGSSIEVDSAYGRGTTVTLRVAEREMQYELSGPGCGR